MKVKRNIIKIDEELCNGCGLCAKGCHEGALQIINGKAKLISELYCDGLGACIGDCPMKAISIEEKEVEAYDEIAVMERIAPQGAPVIEAHLRHLKSHGEERLFLQGIQYLKENNIPFNPHNIIQHSCPGSAQQVFNRPQNTGTLNIAEQNSELTHWPVQLHLLNPQAGFFNGADVLLAADCTAYAYAGFHNKLLKGKKLAIACPKLDSNKESYIDKLTQMIDIAHIKSLTVAIMEVPCCGGIEFAVKKALLESGKQIPWQVTTISTDGKVLNKR